MKKFVLYSSGILLCAGLISTAAAGYYGRELCSYPGFVCVKVHRGDTWERRWPDPDQRDIVMRLNRMNEPLSTRSWVLVPTNLDSIDLMSLSPYPAKINGSGRNEILVDLDKQAFGAYDGDGNLVRWGPVSSAKGYCPDMDDTCVTPTGVFHIQAKEGEDCISKIFPIPDGGAPMPFCMFFSGGDALHGSYELPGYNASHGCIRLFPEDAEWLNEEFADIGTKVVVSHGSDMVSSDDDNDQPSQ